MKKSSKAMRVFVSLFLSCVSSFPVSSIAMVPKSTTPKLAAFIVDGDKPPLKDAMRFYFTIVEAQQHFENNDLKSISETLYSKFVFDYLCSYLSYLNFQKVAEKFRDPNSELLYQRTLSYLVYSYKKLEDLENHLSTLETASAKYDPYGFEKTTMNSLKELISGLSETLKKVISNKNIIKYTNQIIGLYNEYSKKSWPLFGYYDDL